MGWSQQRDSNPRPADYKSAALPTELCWRSFGFGSKGYLKNQLVDDLSENVISLIKSQIL